jgi:GrpB-like predicted nucleotidyltransferase (UPF0157 family)
MLTKEQEEWLSHLDDKNKVEILPYDPKTRGIFEIVKKEIQGYLGDIEVLHRGSTALGISGQGEIDVYIPVDEKAFNKRLGELIGYLGKPRSLYDLNRARFVKYIDNIKIEIFLANKDSEDWKNSVKFEDYLRKNLKALQDYKKLKEESQGLSSQQYYRKKLEFINQILSL